MMRLKEIRTHKLFGLFNHVIPLDMDDRITIIHGPNGYGKTAILRMIADIFGASYRALRSLPFERLELEFDDATSLTITKQPRSEENGARSSVTFEHSSGASYCRPHNPTTGLTLSSREIEDHLPQLARVGEEEWLDRQTGGVLHQDDVADLLPSHMMFAGLFGDEEPPGWLVKLRDSLDVHFIPANRLEQPKWEHDRRRPGQPESTQVVARYAKELSGQIQMTLARYAELSQSLDRSFPQRFVTSSTIPALSPDEIQRNLKELERRRDELTEAGLLDKEKTHFELPAPIDDSRAGVLSVYIRDAQDKLDVFDSLFKKINLFKSILNRRFLFKTVSIDKSKGIVFSTRDENPLSASSLSSGEQHEVVMLYQLLFKLKPQSLMLIDEPELSLHVAWQMEFLSDLAQITELSGIDVLLATHSPQVINDRWDLTVELQGPTECENIPPTPSSQTR